jgi:hypothetical protein
MSVLAQMEHDKKTVAVMPKLASSRTSLKKGVRSTNRTFAPAA